MKLFSALLVASLSTGIYSFAASPKHPYRLGVVISIDQFRADYLMRIPLKNGLKKLRDEGAYFPLADHGLFQNMTCPGHAAILSGAYPYRHGIGVNVWYDRNTKTNEYCVHDSSSKLISSTGVFGTAEQGISPKNFNATTVGDELKNIGRKSQVVAVALKDRAAVVMAGKRADQVVWMNDKLCQWVSSEFYLKDKRLPAWALSQNKILETDKAKKFTWGPLKEESYCTKESFTTPWAVQRTFDLALSAVKEMKLGKGTDTDLLSISLSSHDYLGHRHGPNSEYLTQMTIEEDRIIGEFLQKLAQEVPGGLKDVFVVLTGDHGIPPTPSTLPKEKIPNANLDDEVINAAIESALTEEFGKPKGGKWIEANPELQIFLNQEALKDAKAPMSKVLSVLRKRLLKESYIEQVLSKEEILYERKVPAGELGKSIDRTINDRAGDILIVLKPFYFSDSYPITHMTHYSYDRYVPLVLWGATFKPGIYRNMINVVDLAPTLSSVLGVIPPSQSEGRVLNEVIR